MIGKKKKKSKSTLRRRSEQREINSNDRLVEFSDEENSFYIDEIKERELEEQREKELQKAQKARRPMSPLSRKVIRIVSFIAVLAIALIAGVVLSLTVLFKTESFEVSGNTHYNDTEIIEACGIFKGENIFLAPKAPAERRITDKFAYVEDADVSFRIPSVITIGITEATEGYLVKISDEEYLLISVKGRILDIVSDISNRDIPVFTGPMPVSKEIGAYAKYEDETVMEIIDSVMTVFSDNGYKNITEIDATSTANITFTYDSRIKVRLGLPEDLSYKIRTAMTIITEKIDTNPSSNVQGVLNVSRCNVTKKSYFNEKSILNLEAPKSSKDPSESTEPTDTPDEYPEGESGDENGEYVEETEAELSQDDWYID